MRATGDKRERAKYLGFWLRAGVSVFLLGGCIGAPADYTPELEFAAATTWEAQLASLGPVSEEGWIKSFNDRRLEALVDLAIERNYDLRLAANRVRQLAADSRISRSVLFPALNLGANARKSRTNIETDGGGFGGRGGAAAGAVTPATAGLGLTPGGTPIEVPDPLEEATSTEDLITERIDNYELTGQFRWELDLWGRLRDQASAAKTDVQAAAFELESARLSLAANTAKAWFDVLTARLQLGLARRTLDSFSTTFDIVEGRYDEGTGDALDLRLSQADVASAKSLVERRRREQEQFIRALQVILGVYPDAKFIEGDELPRLRKGVPAGLPSELLARRPDLRAAERSLAGSDKRISAARKDFLPDITLTASGGTSSQELQNVLNSNFLIWNLASDVVQPLFQGGELTARLERAKAVAEQAALEYQQTALSAFSEVENALAGERFLAAQESALAAFLEAAQAAVSLAQDRYSEGTTDIITVLDSQRRAFDAESTLLDVRNLRLKNRVDLHLALGGNF